MKSLIESGSVWCTAWAFAMVIVSMVNPDFAFFGMIAAVALAAGGIEIGLKEVCE